MRKSLIITSEFPPLPGGIGNHAFNLACQMSYNGYQVVVCTDQRSKNIDEDVRFDNSQPFLVKRIKRYKLSLITYFVRLFVCLIQVKKNKTILLSGKFSLWLGAIFKLFFSKKRFIAVLHGSELFAGNEF